MADIILINTKDMFSRYPYLGICYIASALEAKGFKVRIVDASALRLDNDGIISIIEKESPAIVGITTMSMSLRKVYALIQDIKRSCKDSDVVVGGTHVSADPGILQAMGIKWGFAGECERVFPLFCSALISGSDNEIRKLPGLLVIDDGLAKNGPEVVDDLDSLAFPARHLLANDRYYSPSFGGRVTSLLASRGCPYACVFCSSLSRTKMRYRSPENIVEEIEEVIKKYKVEYIEFVDEIFTLNKAWTCRICELIINKGIQIKWGCGTRADLLDCSLLREMRSAGCIKIAFGVETGSYRVRALLNKDIQNRDYITAFDMCKAIGIQPSALFMLGHPAETKEDMQSSIDFARRLNARVTHFSKTVVLPASPLFDTALKEGRVQADVWQQFMLGFAEPPFYVPTFLSERDFDGIYRKALRSIYWRPQYVWGRLKELRRLTEFVNLWRSLVNLLSYYFKRY